MTLPAQEITLSFPFSLLDRIRASFAVIPQRKSGIAAAAIFPLLGLTFLVLTLVKGRALDAGGYSLVGLSLLFYPAVVVTTATITHFCNRHMREPFTYTFNESGIHVSAVSYEYTHRWSAISHVKQFAGFLMFFFSPGCAHCIPLKAVQSAGVFEPLVTLAKAQGANVDRARTR